MSAQTTIPKKLQEVLSERFTVATDRKEATALIRKVLKSETVEDPFRVAYIGLFTSHGDIIILRDLVDRILEKERPVPARFNTLREKAQRIMAPFKPDDANTKAPNDFLFKAVRAKLTTPLPTYYHTYLLLVELLGYKNLGSFEKVSWSVPVDHAGRALLVEHRKFGLGVFVQDQDADIATANELAAKIARACAIATPFFEWHAQQHLNGHRLSVANKSQKLYDRFRYFLCLHRKVARQNPLPRDLKVSMLDDSNHRRAFRAFHKYMVNKDSVEWTGLAAIDAFFSWTEHVFIHIAIMQGKVTTGKDVIALANADWSEKFKSALDVTDNATKRFYDSLMIVRRQLRNFVAHGAFGKRGEALSFHSGAGAIPVTLSRGSFTLELSGGTDFDNANAIQVIEQFIKHLWSGERGIMKLYIQGTTLPFLLGYAKFGRYASVLKSKGAMRKFLAGLEQDRDNARNMDF